jgi:hypothetical protein
MTNDYIELKGEMNYGITINYKFILAKRGFIHIFNPRKHINGYKLLQLNEEKACLLVK